jgi:HxlR-like helix-turn-helix
LRPDIQRSRKNKANRAEEFARADKTDQRGGSIGDPKDRLHDNRKVAERLVNELVLRTVQSTTPVTVEYELTEYGKTLDNVIEALRDWGTKHRKRIIRKA